MSARAARPADPGAACSWIRAAITAAQNKTPGAGPGARGSRCAAGGSGVELIEQLERPGERGLRLFGPAASQHQDGEL